MNLKSTQESLVNKYFLHIFPSSSVEVLKYIPMLQTSSNEEGNNAG